MHQDSSESTLFIEFLAWFEVNRKRIYTFGAIALVVVVAGYVYNWNREQKELAASRELLALKALPASQDNPAIASPQDFLKVANAHASTSAGERAMLLAAGNFFAEGKYSEAQAQFERFAKEHGNSLLAPIAAYGIAASLDAQDKIDPAIAAYESLVAKFPSEGVANKSRLVLAGFYEAKNQGEKALKMYDEVLKPGAGFSAVMAEAGTKKDALLKKYPNLAPTNSASIKPLSVPMLPEMTNKAGLNAEPPAGAPTKK